MGYTWPSFGVVVVSLLSSGSLQRLYYFGEYRSHAHTLRADGNYNYSFLHRALWRALSNHAPPGWRTRPSSLLGFFAVLVIFGLIMMVLIILLSVIFTFSYPLIVDRKLSGIDAVKLSARAALANFWPLLGLLMLNGLLGFAGVLLCYVGVSRAACEFCSSSRRLRTSIRTGRGQGS